MEALTSSGDRRTWCKAQTGAAILDASERLFLTGVYGATTIEHLAEQADVAAGSIYGHFGGKEGVYAALIDRAPELDARHRASGWPGAIRGVASFGVGS